MTVRDRAVWDYEQLSVDAKLAGGPDPFREALKDAGFIRGFAEGEGRGLKKGRLQGSIATSLAIALIILGVKEGPRAVEWVRGRISAMRRPSSGSEAGNVRGGTDGADQTAFGGEAGESE